MSHRTEVWFLDHMLPTFIVKNVYNDYLWKLCYRNGISTEVFCQYELLSTWHGQFSPDIYCGFYNQI